MRRLRVRRYRYPEILVGRGRHQRDTITRTQGILPHHIIKVISAAGALPNEPLPDPTPTAGDAGGAAAVETEAAAWDSEGGAKVIAMEGGADSGTTAATAGGAATSRAACGVWQKGDGRDFWGKGAR